MLVTLAFASTQGPNSGVTAGAAWTSPTNAEVTDGVYATRSIVAGGASGGLSGSTYGFSIPVGATINGITVSIIGHCSATASCDMTNTNGGSPQGICITKVAATCTGTTKLDSTSWLTTDATFTEGSGSDLWGTTWAVSDINSSGFGTMLAVENVSASSRTASVDSILITVTFTPAPTGCKSCFLPLLQSQTRTLKPTLGM